MVEAKRASKFLTLFCYFFNECKLTLHSICFLDWRERPLAVLRTNFFFICRCGLWMWIVDVDCGCGCADCGFMWIVDFVDVDCGLQIGLWRVEGGFLNDGWWMVDGGMLSVGKCWGWMDVVGGG